MRSKVRSLAMLSLAAWFFSGCLTQMLWLHAEGEHAGHSHHETSGVLALFHHSDAERSHEHQFSSSSDLATISGSRLQPPLPQLAFLRIQWSVPARLAYDRPAPDPPPREKPLALEQHTILLI